MEVAADLFVCLTAVNGAGEIVPGTHASAPADAQIGRKAKITTYWAVPLWCIITAIILSGVISVRDIDVFDRMGPAVTSD